MNAKSNKNKYRQIHLQLANNKKDPSGLHKYMFWKKMSGIRFLKGKALKEILLGLVMWRAFFITFTSKTKNIVELKG